ncbi:MAG: N-6 DNA methylase, partial [Candidatus Cloacimonetes bacterium]|nr:N-6 DNA methylase [Candidatus Cloacimonadota bacterium]
MFIRKNTSVSSNINLIDLYKGDFSNFKSNYKVEYTLKKLHPHSFFLFNSEPLLIFFDYSEQINREKREKLSKDVWNFNKSALVFVNTPKELTIYNGFKYNKSGLLEVLETIKDITEYPKLEQYSYWKIVTSELWNAKDEKFKKNTRVDKKLLDNIKTARKLLIDKEYTENPLYEKHANRIIGRLIFIRYLIDRNVKFDYQGKGKELLTKDNLPKLILQRDNLFNFFEYLLKTFNGKILPLNGEKNAIHQNHLIILSDLFAGNEIKARQPSFFNIFDFDFIPVELISNIYETFLSETQDADKAFYTPPFLVDYVLSQTVKPFINEHEKAEKISCKIVDLTCGSGIFLCETLRSIINRYIELTNPDRSSIEFKKKIKQLLEENIYGNDTNQEAIEIAKFSLFITLLDYFENPKDIAGFEFPDISNNFYNYDVFDTNLYKEEKDSNIKLDDIFGENKKIEPDF